MFNVELQLFYVVVSKQHVFIIFFWNVSKVASFFFIKKTFVSCLPYLFKKYSRLRGNGARVSYIWQGSLCFKTIGELTVNSANC